MFDDQAEKALGQIDVPWDELRAARVHKRALEAFKSDELPLDEDFEEDLDDHESDEAASDEAATGDEAASEDVVPLHPARGRWIAVLAVAAALVLVLARPWASPGDVTAIAWQATSSLSYADGSRSLLSEQADVHVIEDRETQVAVKQAAGTVRYEIERRPERRFVVDAHGVTVTVLGTVFEVDVAGDEVTVSVQRGRVRVEHGATQVELTKGQRIALQAPAEATAEEPVAEDDAPSPDDAEDPEPRQADEPDAPEPEAASGGAAAGPSAAALMREADAARGAGRLDEAARKLRRLVALHPRDPRVSHAMFTLGRVERSRGNHGAAAQAFEGCGAALRGDAIAEAAVSWMAAGDSGRAQAAARRYLAAHPTGVQAERMKKLAGGS